MNNKQFTDQAKLILDVLPFVSKEKRFALKGGTAINLFVRDFPRLSLDIDLAYLGDESRDEAVKMIEEALQKIKAEIEAKAKDLQVTAPLRDELISDVKLFIARGDMQVKIEVTPGMRGTLFPAKSKALAKKAATFFKSKVDMAVVSPGDLYGGLIVAALDRQHPRDLFDIKLLFENEGLTDEIKAGFFTYLMSHGRPFHEVLKPALLDQTAIFETEFDGMSDMKFTYQDFEETRARLIKEINESLTTPEKQFLLSFTNNQPEWSLLSHGKISEVPAIKWKLLSIGKMKGPRRQQMLKMLNELW